jgi:hypothetical protein
MRRIHRMFVLATLLAIAPALAGCSDFDPDKLDVFHLNDKKKLPGKREPLFPNGVPGVSQGIPPEYMKGYQQQQDQQADAALAQPGVAPGNNAAAAKPKTQKTAAVTPVETKPKAKPKAKPRARKAKPKPKTKTKTAAPAAAQPAAQPAAAPPPPQQMPPWPAAQSQQQQGTSAPWPSSSTQGNTTTPWPAAPSPGSFSR